MSWLMFAALMLSPLAAFLVWKKSAWLGGSVPAVLTKPAESKETHEDSSPVAVSVYREKKHAEAQEARIVNDVDRMIEALEYEEKPVDRHLLYRDIIAHTFPKRHQDPKARDIFMTTAQAHLKEIPGIITELMDRFGAKPYFFTFSYYAIALTEALEFDRAMEVCRLALAYGAKDALGVGFDRRIEQIAKRKARIEASKAA